MCSACSSPLWEALPILQQQQQQKNVRKSPYSPLENIGENETLQQPLLPFHSRKRLFQAGFLSYCCSVLSDQATPLISAKVITVFVLF